MVKKLIFDPDAKLEIRDATFYYEKLRAGLGEEFIQEVEITVQKLLNTPFLWPTVKGPFRRCLVKRFPYAVIFTVDDYEVFIVAVMHQKRNPDYWVERSLDR